MLTGGVKWENCYEKWEQQLRGFGFDFFFFFETPEQAERESEVFKAVRMDTRIALNTSFYEWWLNDLEVEYSGQ